MPLNAEFLLAAEQLRVPMMGTENVSYLLYSLVRMLRPRSVLEIGAGYTTLFLAVALADAAEDARQDRSLKAADTGAERSKVLSDVSRNEYSPQLYVIDNLRHVKTSARGVPAALDRLGLDTFVTVIEAEFAGGSGRLRPEALPLDFIWFDCGAATRSGVTFLNEYWPLVNADGGLVAFHSMYYPLPNPGGARGEIRVPAALLNEIRKQLADAGRNGHFELLTLVEPHKRVQGDVAIVKKLGPLSRVRALPFEQDAEKFCGGSGPLRRL